MRRHSISIIFTIILSLLLASNLLAKQRAISVRPVSPAGGEVTGSQWLFVIGIDTYIHWPRLNTAVNDAKAVKDVLLSRYHFEKGNLIELYDEQATRKNIIGKLRYLAGKVRKDDSVVIFYAGHGHLDPITKDGSWIPVESGTNDASAWISNHKIKNYLNVDAIKAKHILLISDSCFSGDFFRGHRGKLPEVNDKVIKRAYKLNSRQAITSGGLEPVTDEGFGGNSVFSHFFVKGLKENQKPFFVPSDFFPDIKAGVAENAEQFPRFGSLKDTGGQQGGELVLFLKRGSRFKDLGEEAVKRKEELGRLKQMEVDAKKAEKKEAAEIGMYEKQIAQLNKEIKKMKKRLGSAARRTNASLETILAMVQQKEDQERRLKELEQKRKSEKEKREAEIKRLKEEQQKKRLKALDEDIGKYSQIVNSKYGRDLKETAWRSLIDRYPDGKGLHTGDTDGLKLAFRGVGRLFVKTNPGSAEVKVLNINPRFAQGMELRQGQYRLAVSAKGYLSKQKQVSVTKGKDKILRVSLEPKKARLSADVEPAGARVKILNIVERFHQGIKLDPGKYHLEISCGGHETKKLYVELGPGEEKKLRIRLKRRVFARDGNFIVYTKGIVTDTKTGLEWVAGPDRDTDWNEARSWVQSLNLDGGGWRMPTTDELKILYKKGAGDRNMTPLLKTTGWYVWSGETKGSSAAWYFTFRSGSRHWPTRGSRDWGSRDSSSYERAFAVRSRGDG